MFVGPTCVAIVSIFYATVKREAYLGKLSIGFSFRQQCRENARILVGHCHDGAVGASPLLEGLVPRVAWPGLVARRANDSPRPVNQQSSEVLIPVFTDPE